MQQPRRWPILIYWTVLTLAGVAVVAMWTHLLTTRGTQLLDTLPMTVAVTTALATLLISRSRWPRTAHAIDTTLTITLVTATTIMLARSGINAPTIIMCCVAATSVAAEVRARLERQRERTETTKRSERARELVHTTTTHRVRP